MGLGEITAPQSPSPGGSVVSAKRDSAVAQALVAWEARLGMLLAAIPGVTPPPRVWAGVESRLGLSPTAAVAGRR